MSFPKKLLQQLKQNKLLLVDIVKERVILKNTGKRLRGLCPFHKERTPSFFLSEYHGLQRYHCFGCCADGSVIDFVMHTRKCSFPDAVRFCASRAGLTLGGNPKRKA